MGYSREYQREYQLARYHRRRRWAIEYLGGRCARCGATVDLELDHVDPATKEIELSKLWGVGYGRFLRELSKCQVLCGPCHKAKSDAEQTTRTHGTEAMYQREVPVPYVPGGQGRDQIIKPR